ncbi:MAG TPA: hypothetical protein VGL60_09720 [Acidimicrobiales bacterium]|jgi:hypothetical protein
MTIIAPSVNHGQLPAAPAPPRAEPFADLVDLVDLGQDRGPSHQRRPGWFEANPGCFMRLVGTAIGVAALAVGARIAWGRVAARTH